MVETRFCIICPTIRENTGHVFSRLQDSLTVETDIFILRDIHGRGTGHAQTLNYAVQRLLDPERHTIAVKIDDRMALSVGWQNAVLQAFIDIPRLGVCGLDLRRDPAGYQYMIGGMTGNEMIAPVRIGKTIFTELTAGNVGGVFIASPVELMRAIGDTPVIDGEQYPYFADGWYNRQARKRGYRIGYVFTNLPVRRLEYDDPQSYLDIKQSDTDRIRGRVDGIMTS